jgi:dextranase
MVPYYVNYFRMDAEFSRKARGYCDFIVRYSNILFERSLKDVSMTHMLGDNREYLFEGFDCSAYAEPGKVWAVLRECPAFKCVSLINLAGNGNFWNEGKNEPSPQHDLRVRVLVDRLPKSVFSASPDRNLGRPEEIEYSVLASDRGYSVAFTSPGLLIWNLLVILF